MMFQRPWISRIDISEDERSKFSKFVSNERNYFNYLLAQLAAPMRSMPNVFARMDDRHIALVGELAIYGDDVYHMTKIPVHLSPYKDILDNLDDNMRIVLGIFGQKINIVPHTRRAMATEMIKYAIDYAKEIANAGNGEQVYKFAISTISPGNEHNKRHVQLQRKAIRVIKNENSSMLIVPYFKTPISVPKHVIWNYASFRIDKDKKMCIELTNENCAYVLRKYDPKMR